MIGKTISHYRILAKLGEGGMGVVYRAEDENLHRAVALKFLRADGIGDRQLRGRFWKEAEAAAALDHPNITTVYEIGEADGQTFIAMAFVGGEDLAAKIKHRPLPLEEALDIATQVGEALRVAHERGIVHRDIKPSNIMITAEGRVKVMDFGLAHLTGQTRMTKTGTIMGTPAYMSPEQTRGETVDHRSDIWSLGVVLYEMVAGRLPFSGETAQTVSLAIQNETPEPLTALRTSIPTELDRIVAKALSKKSAERYQHTDELLVDLRTVTCGEKDAVTEHQPPTTGSQSKLRWVLTTALLVAATAVLTWNLKETAEPSPALHLRRLTAGSGLSDHPVVSPDGNLVAYASDRGDQENFDIWLQQVAGGEPVRVTDDPAIDTEPDFSPDGSLIAFRSQREPAGIYVVSTLGGDARFIAPNGREPRFSPDGKMIAYWRGNLNSDSPSAFVAALEGGEPAEIQPGFYGVGYPIWSPDGRHLLFGGKRDARGPSDETYDWWVTPAVGGEAVRTGGRAVLGNLGPARIMARDWVDDGIVFSAESGSSESIWRVRISEGDWQVREGPEQLTNGSGMDTRPRLSASGTLTFAGMREDLDIWALPVRANQGQVTGEIRRLVHDAAMDSRPSLSGDGRMLLYQSDRSGSLQGWMRDLETGKLTQLTHARTEDTLGGTVLSREGAKITYQVAGSGGTGVYVMPVRGGSPQEVCEDCGSGVDWWPLSTRYLLLESWVLMSSRRLTETRVLDLDTGESRLLLRHPNQRVHDACWSPDGRWVAFHTTTGTAMRQIFMARYQAEREIPQEEWTPLTDGSAADRVGKWSPDGNLLFFSSERDGYRCLWAMPLDRETKEPGGEPFVVHHLHGTRFTWPVRGRNLAVAEDMLVFALAESTGNIWLTEPGE